MTLLGRLRTNGTSNQVTTTARVTVRSLIGRLRRQRKARQSIAKAVPPRTADDGSGTDVPPKIGVPGIEVAAADRILQLSDSYPVEVVPPFSNTIEVIEVPPVAQKFSLASPMASSAPDSILVAFRLANAIRATDRARSRPIHPPT